MLWVGFRVEFVDFTGKSVVLVVPQLPAAIAWEKLRFSNLLSRIMVYIIHFQALVMRCTVVLYNSGKKIWFLVYGRAIIGGTTATTGTTMGDSGKFWEHFGRVGFLFSMGIFGRGLQGGRGMPRSYRWWIGGKEHMFYIIS